MKYTKIIIAYMFIVAMGVFTSCDVNEEFYTELDKEEVSYAQTLDYTLTEKDYTALGDLLMKNDATKKAGEKIKKYKNFSESLKAAEYLPYFLKSNYAYLDKGSIVNLTYNYYSKLKYDEANAYELQDVDYESCGFGHPNFNSEDVAEKYVPAILNTKPLFATKAEGTMQTVKWKLYYKESTEYIQINADFTAVELDKKPYKILYTLTDKDYKDAGQKHSTFSNVNDAKAAIIKIAKAGKGPGNYAYTYYKKRTKDMLLVCTKTNSVWGIANPVSAKTSQFIRLSDKWIFDPTVILELSKDDYQLLVDYSNTKHGETAGKYSKNTEYYYGASSYYGNFDVRLKNRTEIEGFKGKSEDEQKKLLIERVKEGTAILLSLKYPKAVAQISGIDVFYKVKIKVYNDTDSSPELKYQCTKSGPEPEFKYIEGLPEEF